MTADYQREKDGHPDVATCAECGVVLEPDDSDGLCVTCEWDMTCYRVGEET